MSRYVRLNELIGLLASKNMTNKDLAEITGIPYTTVCKCLKGDSLFDIVQVSKICSALTIPTGKIPFFFAISCDSQLNQVSA